jgi:tetratricopeptide (TPR) repeat protein
MPGLKELPRTLLRKARVLNALGRHEEAIAVYERVIKDFPSSSYAAESLYQIGFTQEIYLGNLDAAKEAYGKVRETAPGSEFTTLAEERKQAIDLYGQYRSEMTTGGEEEEKAEAALMLAEVALFRLRKVDEALAAYGAVERDHPSSALAPKAAYAVAWIQEHELGDSLAAADSYRRVYESYPDTEYGVEAGVRAGLLAADSLSIYRGRVLQIKAVADSLVALALARAAAARGDSLAAISDSLASAPGDSPRAGLADSALGTADSLVGFQRVQMAPDRGVSPVSPRVESPLDAPSSVREDSLAPHAMPPGVLPGPDDGSTLPLEPMPVTPPESMPPESTAPESTMPPEPTPPDSAGTTERGPE